MSQTQEYSQFTIAHQLKRRIRIIAPSLFRDKERAYILQILLLKREAIKQVKIVPELNSVTIRFNPEQFPKVNLLNLLEIVLANFSQKPRESIRKIAEHATRQDGLQQKLVFGIGGMSCASCALFLEMVLSREEGNTHVSINYISEIGIVRGYLDKAEIFKIVEDNGYKAYSIDTLAERKILLEHEQKHLLIAKKRLILISVLGVSAMIAGLLSGGSSRLRLLQAWLSFAVVFGGGRDIFKKAWLQARQKTLNMDSLIALGAGSAFAVSVPSIFNLRRHSYFDAATAIIGFVQLGRYLEELVKSKMVREVEALVNMQPQMATLLQGEKETQITADKIQVDDVLLIRPGERIPVDGVVISGLSSVDESMITGVNVPGIKEKGHELYDGSINGGGVLRMKATKIGKDTMLARLVHMVDQTQSSKLQLPNTVNLISSRLIPSIMFLSAMTFGGWLARGVGIAHAFSNAISVLLISCPCALGLATPAATSVSSGQAARRKVYIRNGNAAEIMASIDTMIFDKTGTLTEGHARVSDFKNISAMDDGYVVQLAASVEFNSEHLFGKAIVEYAKAEGLTCLKSSKFYSIPDQGVRSQVDGHEVLLGNEHWINEQNIDLSILKEIAEQWSLQGCTLIYMVVDNKVIALFALQDHVREGIVSLMDGLRAQGVETLMVTGDTEASARPIAEFAGINEVTVQASPAKKIQIIRDLQAKGRVVAMIGDGVNDAPALAAADVGLVIGNAAGIAIEAADFVLIDGDITKVAEMLGLSKQTLVVVKQNLFWAFGYNAIAIPFAMAGKLNPTISSAAMALSSLSVIANSLRLRKK
jgi:Cu+-exporting ATPase